MGFASLNPSYGAKLPGTQPRGGNAMTAPETAHRPTIAVTRHAIAAGHYLAATAGFDILQAGGNAIDAGVAAGIALGVVQSDLVNCAGWRRSSFITPTSARS